MDRNGLLYYGISWIPKLTVASRAKVALGRLTLPRKALALLLLISLWPVASFACTTFPINIGVVDTPAGRILAETLAVLINERSGVTVGTHYFKTPAEMAKAVSDKRLQMLVENTTGVLQFLDLPVDSDPELNYEKLKELYKEKDLIWLKPFAFRTKDDRARASITAVVISRGALAQFPALPRLIGKLSDKVDDEALQKLLKEVKGEKKPRNEAKNFLVKNNLI